MSGQLEDPVRTSAEALFEVFPEWRSLARREVDEDGSQYVVVEVSPPSEADANYGLFIDTRNDEVTVGFDFYHRHFDDWADQSGRFGTESALDFVQQIGQERVAVVSWWRDDTWLASSVTEAGAPLEPREPRTSEDTHNRVRVRSWSGALNVDSDA